MSLRASTRRKEVVVLLIVSMATLITGVAGQRREQPPWKELEGELTHQGLKTDTVSLVELARSDRREETRWTAIEILGLRGEQAARQALHEIADNDQSRFLRESAAVALARLGDSRGISSLHGMLKSSPTQERQIYLASQLATQHDPSGYSYVVTATQSKDAYLRYLAAGALASFVEFQVKGVAGIDAVEQLILRGNDTDPKVRNEAVTQFALAVYKGASIAKFRPIVEEMARNDPSQEVKENAANILALWKEQCRTDPSIRGCT